MAGWGWGIAATGLLMVAGWFVVRRRIEVPCTIDVEASHDTFHAHVNLEGVEVDPGDSVLVHGAPSRVCRTARSRVDRKHGHGVSRASWLRRQFVKLTGRTEIYALYDVGFEG